MARRWRDEPRSTAVLLGVAAAGPYAVDLRRDGPHALVGGTTGAGKSELLQTMIASLALGNRPDEMAFVLVDYKGGSAFKDCARLPHTVGLVTDLDGHLTARALASLEAELTRREHLLGQRGAKDIEDYQAGAGPDDPRLPRLVLVIDEFKMLAEELPGFVDGLVRIAAVGRSLGIHLVLATQRPGGIVSADIKANVNLRIALRVRDTVDSEDVIDAPAAQAIPERTPGRAYLRSGAQPLVAFQTARVGGRGAGRHGDEVTVSKLRWETLGDPPPREPVRSLSAGPTDLTTVVMATTEAASRMDIAPAPSPWLPPLPDLVVADTLEAPAWHVPYALADLPRQQDQRPVTWDLEHGDHLAVAGASRTGRTSFLRALGGTLAARFSPADVHLYGFDGSAGALQALARLPHTGAVVHRDDAARCDRLVSRLLEEIRLRQLLLARHGFGSVVEQRRAATVPRRATAGEPPVGPPLPYLVLLLDSWQELATSWEAVDHGRPVESLLRVLREGGAVGVRAVLTGDRSVLLSKVGSVVADRLVLRMTDPTDLLMAGISGDAVPVHQPPGRAVRVSDSVEMQLALLGGGTDGPSQIAALDAIALTAASTRDGADGRAPRRGPRPFRVEALPTDLSLSQLRGTPSTAPPAAPRLAEVGEGRDQADDKQADDDRADDHQADAAAGTPVRLVLGVGGDELDAIGSTDVGQGANTLVAGPARSGRSTTLLTIATQLLAAAPAAGPAHRAALRAHRADPARGTPLLPEPHRRPARRWPCSGRRTRTRWRRSWPTTRRWWRSSTTRSCSWTPPSRITSSASPGAPRPPGVPWSVPAPPPSSARCSAASRSRSAGGGWGSCSTPRATPTVTCSASGSAAVTSPYRVAACSSTAAPSPPCRSPHHSDRHDAVRGAGAGVGPSGLRAAAERHPEQAHHGRHEDQRADQGLT